MPRTILREKTDNVSRSQISKPMGRRLRLTNTNFLVCFSFGLLLVAVSTGNAQAILENFDDGDDTGWIALEVAHSGSRNVVDGVYQLTTDAPVSVGDLGHITSRFDSKSPIGDGFLRAKVTANTLGTSAAIGLFTDSNPAEYYVFNGSSQDGGFNLWRSNGNPFRPNLLDSDKLGSPSGLPRFQEAEDWWLELGVVEGWLSVKAWPDGSSIPDEPQFTYFDSDPHPIAQIGVGGWISTGWRLPVNVDASFDDVSFVPRSEFDCNLDRVVNVADANCSLAENLDATIQAANLILGDMDGDGTVNFEDFLTLSQNFGTAGNYTDGDLDVNGRIEFSDYLILSSNFGQSASRFSAVPEPAGIAWWSGSVFVALTATRRR